MITINPQKISSWFLHPILTSAAKLLQKNIMHTRGKETYEYMKKNLLAAGAVIVSEHDSCTEMKFKDINIKLTYK